MKKNEEFTINIESLPVVYSDYILGLNVSAGTAKLILGNEGTNGKKNPTSMIVLPVKTLYDMVSALTDLLDKPEFQEQMHKDLQVAIDNFKKEKNK